jgi:hypothetical protein
VLFNSRLLWPGDFPLLLPLVNLLQFVLVEAVAAQPAVLVVTEF